MKVGQGSARLPCLRRRCQDLSGNRNARSTSPLLPLFVLCLTVYLFSAGGHFYVVDHVIVYSTTQAIAERGSLNIAPELGFFAKLFPNIFPWFSPESTSVFYSSYGLLQSFLAVPLYLAAKWAGVQPWRVVTTILVPLLSAITVCLVYAISRRLGDRPTTSLILSLLYGFTTIAWPYVKFFYDSPTATMMVVASLYFLFDGSARRRSILLSGLFATLAVFGRVTAILVLPAMILYAACKPHVRFRERVMNVGTFLLPVAMAALIYGYLNLARNGSPVNLGLIYESINPFAIPINQYLVGIYGMLLSSGEGLFVYYPLCALGFLALLSSRPERRWESFVLCEFFLVTLLFFARLPFWYGWGAWGARYLVPTVPCLIVALGPFIESNGKPIAGKLAVAGAATIGFFCNLLGVLINYEYAQAYLFDIGAFSNYPEPGIWIPRFSQVAACWHLLWSPTYPANFYPYVSEFFFFKSRLDLYLYNTYGLYALVFFCDIVLLVSFWLVVTVRRNVPD